ncbi:HEAT repeat domain-containing protein [Cohnella hashimotonis]|uniref:HEAT repeat domain-containing protein n=1 Tax=Cohnella hashimotonis TaxID=2826895 RepID=A0ABT6TQ23_9BACL|nr:HEAT repeat domain-containing protein [Cohnella hashimotonis]MDI4647907.1 HEAT repeat domain-containing protein [Cohnella hashimotonis]
MDNWYKIIQDPNKDMYQKLDEQVDEFWHWSKSVKQDLEWETNYPHWTILNTIFNSIIETTDPNKWDRRTINNLLYILGRDNECELLIQKLSEFPASFIFLSEEGIHYPDRDAKWQLAHYLTKCTSTHFSEAEQLLIKYYEDENEYVKRHALLALGIIKSNYAEKCALNSWSTGIKYQRIAALQVLKQLDSPHYDKLQR